MLILSIQLEFDKKFIDDEKLSALDFTFEQSDSNLTDHFKIISVNKIHEDSSVVLNLQYGLHLSEFDILSNKLEESHKSSGMKSSKNLKNHISPHKDATELNNVKLKEKVGKKISQKILIFNKNSGHHFESFEVQFVPIEETISINVLRTDDNILWQFDKGIFLL